MAQYVYSILKPKGKFNIAEAIDIKYDDNKTLKDVIGELSDNISSIKPGGDGSKELYIGTSQPYNTDLVWIDTSDLDNEIKLVSSEIKDISNERSKLESDVYSKNKRVNDIEYKKQLNIYREYISSITNKKVYTYLYSIIDNILTEV